MKIKIGQVKYGDATQGDVMTLYCEQRGDEIQTYIDNTELGLFPSLSDAMASIRIAWSGWDTYVEGLV